MFIQQKYINGIFSLALACILLLMASCEKPKKYSNIPEIKFLDITVTKGFDALDNPRHFINVHFSFTDGDGNLGLDDYDTLGDFSPGEKHYNNIILTFYEKVNGIIQEKTDIGNLKFRFKNISKQQTTNKLLKGEMKVDMDIDAKKTYADTCFLEFYIKDRTVNQSNIERTTEIYLNE